MSKLYVRQLNDGEQSGEEVVCIPQYDDQPVEELFARKVASHRKYGWTVELDGDNKFHAFRTYDEEGKPGREDRYFEIRE